VQPAAAVSPSAVPFPAGSALCNDSLTDSNPLNVATAKLSSDGRTLSLLITLDSPYPVHTGRAFKIAMGTVQHQTDYVAEIDENGSGGPKVSVTDGRTGHATPVPDAAATITDQKVNARIPTADLPRLGGHFLWKAEAFSSGQDVDACPDENSAGVRVWLDFPGG
jgi:hypothetical protein